MEILHYKEHSSKEIVKEILTSFQLILCHSENLPLYIIGDVFDSILIIINSTEKIAMSLDGK